MRDGAGPETCTKRGCAGPSPQTFLTTKDTRDRYSGTAWYSRDAVRRDYDLVEKLRDACRWCGTTVNVAGRTNDTGLFETCGTAFMLRDDERDYCLRWGTYGTNDAGVLLQDYECCGSNTKHVDAVPLLLFSPTCNIRDCIANAGQHLQCDNNKYISFENI